MNMVKSFTAAVPNYSDSIRKIAEKQPIYFRTESFGAQLQTCEEILLETIGCKKGEAVFLTASGTGAMDAAITNLVDKEDRILVINGGTWGERWLNICNFYGLSAEEFKTEPGRNLDMDKLKKLLNQKSYSVVLCQHNETSTMQLHPVQQIGELSLKHNFKLIVDAISSFMIDPFTMDEWNIYAAVLSANKGVGVYPGLAMVVLSEYVELKSAGSYYFDFKKYLNRENIEFLLPFTPSIVSINQLYHRLQQVHEDGIDMVVESVRKRAEFFRNEIQEKNLPFSLLAETPSNCGSVLLTDRTDVKTFFNELQQKDIYFTPSGGETGGKFIISHIGDQKMEYVEQIINELSLWVKKKR
jgi:aspartate aminotransferase-like enzyme